jgi:twitching motility protein PilT
VVEIQHLLQEMIAKKGSDLHIAAGSPPRIRVKGRLAPIKHPVLSAKETKQIIYNLLSKKEIKRFEQDWELETSLEIKKLGKFSANVFRQRDAVGAVFRLVS